MILIAAADRNWGIGKDGDLLARISEDMRFFAGRTTGNVIVIGRKTLESFPGAGPLPNRVNIVLTRDRNYEKEGAVIVHSAEELFRKLADYPDQEIFAAGGGSVYRMLLPYCDSALITRIEETFEADISMPDLDSLPGWELVQRGEDKEDRGRIFHFDRYVNHAPETFSDGSGQ